MPFWSALRALIAKGPARRALAIAVGIQFFAQASGINAVLYYTPIVLREAGVEALFVNAGLSENAASILATILVFIPKVPAMIIAMHWMDSVGRRYASYTPFLDSI